MQNPTKVLTKVSVRLPQKWSSTRRSLPKGLTGAAFLPITFTKCLWLNHPTDETSEGHPRRRASAKRKTSPSAAAEKKKRVLEVFAEEEEEKEEKEISSSMTKEELEEIVSDYRLDPRVITCQLPAEGEVAGFDVSHLVCLFRYMFLWGLRIPLGAAPLVFWFLVAVLAAYGLSQGNWHRPLSSPFSASGPSSS